MYVLSASLVSLCVYFVQLASKPVVSQLFADLVTALPGEILRVSCFSPLGHTCKKLGHSCLRKVVSFSAWPLRKRWRFLHRALEAAWFLRVWVMRSGH